MKLYVFDSCPYCVRVRALIGLKNIDCEVSLMTLGDIPERIKDNLEKFTVPILECIETDTEEFMTESLAIFNKLDRLSTPLFDHYEISEKVTDILTRMKSSSAQLCYPRMVSLNLPELSTEDALSTFESSRERILGQPLSQALEKTEEYVSDLLRPLQRLEKALDVKGFLDGSRDMTIDDIIVFAELRTLSMVGELTFSPLIRDYLDIMSSCTKMNLYTALYK